MRTAVVLLRPLPLGAFGAIALATRVAQEIDPDVFKDAFAAGSELNQREAVEFVRGDRMMEA